MRPQLEFGSFTKYAMSLWPQLYDARFRNFGNTATILNFGDREAGAVNATTFTTRREHANGIEAVFTWSEAPSAFDTAFDLTSPANWQGVAPVLRFNGTDEEADTPDATYWSRGDGVADAVVSIGFWAYITDTAAERTVLAKWDAGVLEWYVAISGADRFYIELRDVSAARSTTRTSDAAVTQGAWTHLVVTYDGSGGASAGNGITMYQNGAVLASTAGNDALYVAMENSTSRVTLAMQGAVVSPYSGRLAGGPLGPFFVQANLTAAQVKNDYLIGAYALGLL